MTATGAAHADSLARFAGLHARERSDPRINPDCYSVLLDHGHATRRAAVFLHGITSSPFQFRQLGTLFYDRGYNVLIPRLPSHGYLDRMTPEPAGLTRLDFERYVSEAVDIGRGLGEHLSLAGLSVGGVLATWAAQTRPDVDLATAISPSFAPYGVPFSAVPLLARLVKRLPNAFVWWHPLRRQHIGPICSYPRYSTHAMVEAFRVGLDVYAAAGARPPASRSILTVLNPGDRAVNNQATRAVLRRWRAHGSATIREYEFGRQPWNLHDIIGPYQDNARIDYVYPILFDLIDAAV